MSTKELVKSEVQDYAKFNIIRYAQVWEDAEILLKALEIDKKDVVLSIASSGENAFSMLIKNPKHVYAIDLSQEQIMCCSLKVAAYKYLDYQECMELLGVFESNRRKDLYAQISSKLSEQVKTYYYSHFDYIEKGIINCGKFEKYLTTFGLRVLPLVHSKKTIQSLLLPKTKEERIEFYDKVWNNRRWRLLFKIFFSRRVMGRLGRDEAFFRYVKVDVASSILEHTKYAITELDPSENSYLHYILNGKYDKVLPVAYREENFEKIKKNIDKLTLHEETVESFVENPENEAVTKYNLSDIFEYMSDEQMIKIMAKIIANSPKKARIAYWNMLAEKNAHKYFDEVINLDELADKLWHEDKAFFYNKFLINEIK
jgi:S-adenosylmethionine-diacylglycerol 3-amino-3-carboxypropyl transferase